MSGEARWVDEDSAAYAAMLADGWEPTARRWVQDAFWSVLMVRVSTQPDFAHTLLIATRRPA